MPIGIIVNAAAVVIGGIIGSVIKDRLSDNIKTTLNMIFGLCAFGMGITSVILMENMPAVILATIVGTLLGIIIHLQKLIAKGAKAMQTAISGFVKAPKGLTEEEFMSDLVMIIVIFVASGTGVYGSIISGVSGDHTILIAKSILDLFTSLIFGCSLGLIVSFIAVPQFIFFFALFLLAKVIYPLTTPTMINDFKAAGGFILLATGFKMTKLKDYPTGDMIPAMFLALPLSWFWTNVVIPFLNSLG